jgi:hypothetical protein
MQQSDSAGYHTLPCASKTIITFEFWKELLCLKPSVSLNFYFDINDSKEHPRTMRWQHYFIHSSRDKLKEKV